MREDFDKNILSDIQNDTCPHDVATLLKEFLRDLPEPLLCSGLYKAFLETQRIRNRRLQLEAISHLVKLLPMAHRDTLYVLLKFLARVASCSDDVTSHDGNVQVCGNRMDSNNLATVFAPNILRTNLSNISSANALACANSIEQESMNEAINVIRIMIDHYEEIFKVPAELIDIVYSHMLDVCPENLYSICEQRIQSIRNDVGNSCSSLNSAEQSLSPLTTTSASNISSFNVESGVGGNPSTLPSSNTTAKRLYTRESVMHDNDACRVTEAAINGSNDGKRSSSSSRHSMTQKLRHDNRKGNAANSDMVDRRQSSPNIFDKSGIVSASLQIQVPVAQASHLKLSGSTTRKKSTSIPDEQTTCDLDEVFYKSGTTPSVSKTTSSLTVDQLDFTDIPYFEDATNTHELENLHKYIPIAGSLSISTKIEGSAKDYRQVHIVEQQKQQQIHNNRTGRSRLQSIAQQPAVSGQYTSAELQASSTQSSADAAYPSKYDLLFRKKPENLEPKSPASISNIGGAILRSKTADFEKMSVNKQAMQRTSTNTPDTAMSVAAATTPHLYKRQELIQSAIYGKAKK